MTSDLQNRDLNFSVLLFPHLKWGVIIQASDINWVWSPQMKVERESKIFLEILVVEGCLMFEARF